MQSTNQNPDSQLQPQVENTQAAGKAESLQLTERVLVAHIVFLLRMKTELAKLSEVKNAIDQGEGQEQATSALLNIPTKPEKAITDTIADIIREIQENQVEDEKLEREHSQIKAKMGEEAFEMLINKYIRLEEMSKDLIYNVNAKNYAEALELTGAMLAKERDVLKQIREMQNLSHK